MPGFGFGASKESSQSTSNSFSTDFSVNQSNSNSISQGSSESFSGGQSTQSIAFKELFDKFFGGASNAADVAAQNTGIFQGEAAQLFSGGTDFLKQLQGNAATDYLEGRVTGPDDAANAQLDALGQNLGDFFNEQLLPGITGRGVSTGTLGGSRQAVAQGMAAKQVAGQYSTGAAQILSNSQAQRDAAAGTLGAQKIQGAATGLNALPQLLGLSQAGANASLSPYLALAQVLGGPTVLTESQQYAQASSQDIATAISEALGYSAGSSNSSSQSSSKGKSFNVGVGVGGGGGAAG